MHVDIYTYIYTYIGFTRVRDPRTRPRWKTVSECTSQGNTGGGSLGFCARRQCPAGGGYYKGV